MPRIPTVDRSTADPTTARLLDSIERSMGKVPNVLGTMAQSAAVANAYLKFSQALGGGELSPRLREQIALAVAEANGCGYCVAAHTTLGKGVGLSEEEALAARRSQSTDPKERAALEFALQVVVRRGAVDGRDLDSVRDAGYSDGEISEIVAHVALSSFTNYFNLVAETEVDFPAAPDLVAA